MGKLRRPIAARELFKMTDENIERAFKKFDYKQYNDLNFTYIFTKAFYTHIAKMYLTSKKRMADFGELYKNIKVCLHDYYVHNTEKLTDDYLSDVLNVFEHRNRPFKSVRSRAKTDDIITFNFFFRPQKSTRWRQRPKHRRNGGCCS